MKTVSEYIKELGEQYAPDAEVTSAKIVVDNGRIKSTMTYSAKLAKQLAKMREGLDV